MRLRTIARALAAAALGIAALAPALAQEAGNAQQERPRARRASVLTLPVSVLEGTLQLTADQKTKIASIQEKYRDQVRALRPAQGAQPDQANAQKLREAARQALQEIQAVLTPEQRTRLRDAGRELAALAMAGIPLQALGDLKLTADQKSRIAAITREAAEKRQALSQEERRTKGREIFQEVRTKVEALLTAEQKAVIEKYRRENPRQRRQRGV